MARSRLVDATFEARPNRFIVRSRLADGNSVDCHLADPGRLAELLLPGARLRLRPVPPDIPRKTRYTAALVATPGRPLVWVSVEAARANRLAEELLRGGAIPGIPGGAGLRAEVRHGASRFDFLHEQPGRRRHWIEVKSVTLVDNGLALFPDAPTMRGRRHVVELTERRLEGDRATILFVVQRADARAVAPHGEIDPEFTEALREAKRARVGLQAVRFRMTADGGAVYEGRLPLRLAKTASASPRARV